MTGALAGLRLIESAAGTTLLYQEAEAGLDEEGHGERRWRAANDPGREPETRARAGPATSGSKRAPPRSAKESVLTAAFRKPITIEFRDTPLKTVFEVISRTSGLNFVFDKDVRADQKTTIFLRNSTIEAAINVLLLTNQLEQRVLDGNSILIYPNTPAKQKEYQALTGQDLLPGEFGRQDCWRHAQDDPQDASDIVVDEKLNLLMIRDSLGSHPSGRKAGGPAGRTRTRGDARSRDP
jgi:general secretion pathway protein D